MQAKDMPYHELHRAASVMESIGGHFASRIAQAFFYADVDNARRLVEAFPHLFEKYGPGTTFYRSRYVEETSDE